MTAGKKPLIVQIITRLIVGGAQLTVLELCEALREHYEVELLSGPEEGPEGSLQGRAAKIVPLTIVPALRRDVDPRQDIAAVIALRRILRELRPSIVHTHSSKAGIVGRVAALRSGAKLVHTVHGWGHTPADTRLRSAVLVGAERIAARWTDALVAVSRDVRDEGLQCGIGHPKLYELIPASVDYRPTRQDFATSRQSARRSLGLRDCDEVIGWVGRFVPQKDPNTLAHALELILTSRRTARAVLVGDGPLRHQIERRLREFGLAERVSFVGIRPDARSLYAAFDVLLHPSLWEGQATRVIQEAIAERVPVVAARVSGTLDLVEQGRTGYVTEPGDGEGIAASAIAVLEGTVLRAPLDDDVVAEVFSRRGREFVLDRHLELYERLLGT